PNFARLIFASNSTQVLQAGIRERRYLVLEPSPEKAQSREYFDRLYSWLNDGGAAKLLWHLKGVDLSGFDPQRAPQTDALREEILLGLSGVELFLYGELINEPPFNGEVRLFA
ncbi:helicase, partial [Escherichia coli]